VQKLAVLVPSVRAALLLVGLSLLGCADSEGRYQALSGQTGERGVAMVLDTHTGRLCLSWLPGTDTGDLSSAQLCDPTLYNPQKMVDSLALVMETCRDTLNVPVPKQNEDPIEAAIEAGNLRGRLKAAGFSDEEIDLEMGRSLRLARCRELAVNSDGIDPEIRKRAREREAERAARGRTP